MKIEIKIPFKTPTINHLYTRNRYGNPCKTNEANKLKEEIKEIIYKLNIQVENFLNKKLKVIVEVHENWYCKNGSVKKMDISNREKFLIDSVFDALGMDDKFIFEHTMKKCQDTETFSIIKIEELK